EAKITNVRAGLPSGPMAGKEDTYRGGPVFKAGHWSPILVTIEGKGSLTNVELTTQFVDPDGVLGEYTVKIPVLEFTAELASKNILTYARPAKSDVPLVLQLKVDGRNLGPAFEASLSLAEKNDYLYLTIGSRLPGLRPPGANEKDFRRCEVAAIDRA